MVDLHQRHLQCWRNLAGESQVLDMVTLNQNGSALENPPNGGLVFALAQTIAETQCFQVFVLASQCVWPRAILALVPYARV